MIHFLRRLLKAEQKRDDAKTSLRHIKGAQSDMDLTRALMFPKTAGGLSSLPPPPTRSKSIDSHALLTNATGVCRTPFGPHETIDSRIADSCRFGHGSLDSLLENKRQMKSFKTFLRCEFSEENMEFFMACERFRRIKGQKKIASKARKIYKTFIDDDSPKQVNLDSVTRSEISALLDNPNICMFDSAQRRVQNMLENDSYRRFLAIEQFRKRTQTF